MNRPIRHQLCSHHLTSMALTAVTAITAAALVATAARAAPIGTAFSYQGDLLDNNLPLNGPVTLRFRLFSVETGGIPDVAAVTVSTTASAGKFTVPGLDFPGADWSQAKWLEVGIVGPGSVVTVLAPRQRLTPTVAALYATNAAVAGFAGSAGSATNANFATSASTATNSTQLGGFAATDYPRLAAGNNFNGLNRFLNPTSFGTGVVGLSEVEISSSNQLALRSASTSSNGTWTSIGNTSAGGREYNLVSTGSASAAGAGEFLIRDGSVGAVRLNIDTTGRFGFNTTNLEEMLTAGGGMTLDQANTNAGTVAGGLRFGGGSGEAIGSNRNAPAPNQFGLDFYSDFTRRLSIQQNGTIFMGKIDSPGSTGTVTFSPNADLNGNHVMRIDNNNGVSGDGLAIRIANFVPSAANNFVTFLNGADGVAGRIEGYNDSIDFTPPPLPANALLTINQATFDRGDFPTLGQTQSYVAPSLNISTTTIAGVTVYRPPFTFNSGQPAIYGLAGGRLPSLTLPVPAFVITPPTSAEASALACWAVTNGNSFLANTQLIAAVLRADPVAGMQAIVQTAYRICQSGGVTYGSKGADYAEWLRREDGQPKLPFGAVVGVRNGRISLDTNTAQQCLVVSRNPIVLGNTPSTSDQSKYEKVGFLGQVHVIVIGLCAPGDYIIASGNSDGTAIAVEPAKFTHDMLGRFIGRAWEGSGMNNVGYINTAVGMTPDAVKPILASTARAAEEQAKVIDSLKHDNQLLRAELKQQLASFEQRLAKLEAGGSHAAR